MSYRKKPPWLRMPERGSEEAARIRAILRRYGLETVCRSAMCPNLGHCFQRGTATFLILGATCTRSCRYCAIERSEVPLPPPDPGEPGRIASAASEMELSYVVITSVTRDDLQDGGAAHFASVVDALRKELESVTVEVLTPDFNGDTGSLAILAASSPDVFNHNLETVERLFQDIRPEADYSTSLRVLREYGRLSPGTPLKSGLMLGLGETRDEIEKALLDLRAAGVTMLTMGQYLQPSRKHWPVDRYLTPEEFDELGVMASGMGFGSVASGPLVRSSFHADTGFRQMDQPPGSSSL